MGHAYLNKNLFSLRRISHFLTSLYYTYTGCAETPSTLTVRCTPYRYHAKHLSQKLNCLLVKGSKVGYNQAVGSTIAVTCNCGCVLSGLSENQS